MDHREAFIAAWINIFPNIKPPSTEFLQFCGCGGENRSQEQIFERINLCKERLDSALNVLKSEGFILKWLTGILHTKDVYQSDSELVKVLNMFFPSSFEPWTMLMDTAPKSVTTEVATGTESTSVSNEPNGNNSNLLDNCDLNEERNKAISEVVEAGFVHGSEQALGGSEDEKSLELDFNNKRGMTGVPGKLFSSENNEFDEEECSLYDDQNTTEGNKLLSNNNTEERVEHDVRKTISREEENPTGSNPQDEQTVEEMSHESNSPDTEKPAGRKDRTLATVFSPLSKGINKAIPKGKWQLPRSPLSSSKHRRNDSKGSAASSEGDDFSSHHTESETPENLDSEVLSDDSEVRIKLNDIYLTNQADIMAGEGGGVCSGETSPIERHGDVVDFRGQGNSEDIKENKSIESEGNARGETADDSSDVILEVVDELISYLEGIEVVSSDEFEAEGESPHEEEEEPEFMLFGGAIRPRKPHRPRKQLGSVMSIGNVSLMSTDSCVAPWSIDVAASEMQSADSSGEEDNVSSETRPSPGTSPGCGLPNMESKEKLEAPSTPPPKRPPRRSKTERLSRTLETPKKLIKASVSGDDDDDVFGKGMSISYYFCLKLVCHMVLFCHATNSTWSPILSNFLCCFD